MKHNLLTTTTIAMLLASGAYAQETIKITLISAKGVWGDPANIALIAQKRVALVCQRDQRVLSCPERRKVNNDIGDVFQEECPDVAVVAMNIV